MTEPPPDPAPAITDADRPDPARQREASQRYAERYARSHQEIEDEVAYRAGYADIIAIDGLLSFYRMLDVGCGTGGYLRLAGNAAQVTAIDFSQAMIDAAQKLQAELGLSRVNFLCRRFEDFDAAGTRFDVVRMGGVVGWYKPWIGNEDALVTARDLTEAGGIVVATYVPPRNLVQWIKAALFRGRTVVITRRAFRRIVASAGLEPLFAIESSHATLAFLRKAKSAGAP